MNVPFVDLKSQYLSIKDRLDSAIQSVIDETAFIGGKYLKNFETEFATYCESKYCVGVGNGTDALYIALRSLGIGHGDEVITVANSFIATPESITMTGAKVKFVDCDPETYNIDITKIESKITSKTKAILPVHLFGQPADMLQIQKMAKKYSLFIIEDAAQAHGAKINGIRVGNFSDIACFSFYPGKNLGAYGDGGAIITNDEELALKCRMIANHGRTQKYNHEFEAVNSRLDALQASILSAKLISLDEWNEKRRNCAQAYQERLSHLDSVVLPQEVNDTRHVYHLYVIRVSNRDNVLQQLRDRGVNCGIHYPITLPNLDAYKYLGHQPDDFPNASKYSNEILSLPVFPDLSMTQIDYVCEQLKEIL